MRVLIVEDDLLLADVLTESLRFDGHEVCGVAATVAEGVALARHHRPDVAVLDMYLRRGEHGSDVAYQLQLSGELAQTGVLYVTGEVERVFQDARVGHACLGKPYQLSAMNAALDIVRDIALRGSTSRALPRGLRLMVQPEAGAHSIVQQQAARHLVTTAAPAPA
jgi:DNA-binding response OmpR family regulator